MPRTASISRCIVAVRTLPRRRGAGRSRSVAPLQGLQRHRADRARPAAQPNYRARGGAAGVFHRRAARRVRGLARQLASPITRVMSFSMLGVVLPGFVVGPLLALVFGIYWPIFRVGGYEPGQSEFPRVAGGHAGACRWRPTSPGSCATASRKCCARTSFAPRAPRASTPRAVFLRHALRPALIPVVSYLGPAVAFVVTGSLVVESVFGLPGSGPLPHPGRRRSRLSHWSWE